MWLITRVMKSRIVKKIRDNSLPVWEEPFGVCFSLVAGDFAWDSQKAVWDKLDFATNCQSRTGAARKVKQRREDNLWCISNSLSLESRLTAGNLLGNLLQGPYTFPEELKGVYLLMTSVIWGRDLFCGFLTALNSQLVNSVAIDIASAEKPQGRCWS